MKTIKILFGILFLGSMFVACESELTQEEVGIEEIDIEINGSEDEDEEVTPEG